MIAPKWGFIVLGPANGLSRQHPKSVKHPRGPRAPAAPWNYEILKQLLKTEPDGAGYWEVNVRRSGRYEFTAGLGSKDLPPAPLKAGTARFQLGETMQEQSIGNGDSRVSFAVRLKAGPARLEISLRDQRRDGQVISPFFVNVRYLGR